MADRHYVRCTVVGNALAESKEKRTPSIKIRLQAIPGANPPIEGYSENRSLWVDLWLTEAALDGTIETLEKVLGWKGSSFSELNEPCFEGVEVDAACEWEENTQTGKWYEKVVFINAPGGGGVKKMEDGQAKAIVSRLDALLLRHRQNSPGGKTSPAPRKAAPGPSKPAQADPDAHGYQEPPRVRKGDLPEEEFFG